ncbi:ATP-binding cassette sub-family C member 4 [Caligus rogercresseyi]|uniref:ATP-binding cassette sub-family C member 4 n=1 Tax=Caligus rogercresseyi TaxID=217165 RepID=A0A7T8QUY6_CALRO|nr:ATP-binding cassette sub-family C member 4 [Caligus rogercresseyi]
MSRSQSIHDLTGKWSASASSLTLLHTFLQGGAWGVYGHHWPRGQWKEQPPPGTPGRIPFTAGSINLSGKISYASQEAWIFDGTVRQNI